MFASEAYAHEYKHQKAHLNSRQLDTSEKTKVTEW